MGYTLYGSLGSGSAAIEAALRACEVDHRIVTASTWEPDSAIDELARINPLRQVPTLVLPDGSVMTESAAILIHLGLAHPQAALLPDDAAARAQALRGLVYVAANCYTAIGIDDHPERWTTATSPGSHAKLRAGTRARLHQCWEIFADTFAARPFLVGQTQPGALDMLAAVVSRWAGTRAHLARHRPAFLKTLQRIERHERIAPVWLSHWSD